MVLIPELFVANERSAGRVILELILQFTLIGPLCAQEIMVRSRQSRTS